MMNQKPKTEQEVIAIVNAAIEKMQNKMVEEINKQASAFMGFKRVLNRRYWWEFWKPKYRYPELEGDYELKVNAGESLPVVNEPKGRVVKVTAPPEFDPEKPRTGGRVVKRMPRQLQQMKEAQETPRE